MMSEPVAVNDILAATYLAHAMLDGEMVADTLAVARDRYSPELTDGAIITLADALEGLCMHTRGDFEGVPRCAGKAGT